MKRIRALTAPFLGAALALALGVHAGPAFAEPTAEEKAGARAAATEASSAFEQKRYGDALDLLQRAESLVHAPTHLLMIARCQVALGQLVKGRESYMALSREALSSAAPQAFRDAQAEGKRELEVLEPRIPTINVKVSDLAAKNVIITMDGAVVPPALVGIARPVDPGSHTLQAKGEGMVSNETKVEITEGQKFELVLDLRPSGEGPSSSGGSSAPPEDDASQTGAMTYLGFGGIGLGAAGIGVGVVFLALGGGARSDADDAYAACDADPCFAGSARAQEALDFDEDANTKQTIGVISLIAGGALAAGGLTLLLVDQGGGAKSDEASITPWIGLGSAGARGKF